jgi:hypothetical protein
MRIGSRNLILPEGGLPNDLTSGIIRVVDGKHYHLDDYISRIVDD